MRALASIRAEASPGRATALPYGLSLGGVLLAASLPILFLHLDYQPKVRLGVGGASVDFKLSDAAVLVVVLAAVAAARARGLRPLRAGLPVWITGALFVAWIVAATFYPLLSARAYDWKRHLVTAGEFGEYALLAPAVPLLLRRRADGLLALGTLLAWTAIAVGVAVAQWLGWSGLGGWGRGFRQPSFLGTHDFAALAGMTLGAGLVALLFGARDRHLRAGAAVAVVAGVVGVVLGGASAAVLGLVPATVIAVVVALRRARPGRGAVAAAAVAAVACALGVLVLRSSDFTHFFRYVGLQSGSAATSANIQTYVQHSLLAYVGLRIWLDHPVVGVGWQGSLEQSAYGPQLAAAHRRFPHVSGLAFPAPAHPYGPQILYVQVLAELGVVGAALLAALAGAGLLTGLRGLAQSVPLGVAGATLGLFWIVLAFGCWAAEGAVAGIPLDALTWLGFGLVSWRPEHA